MEKITKYKLLFITLIINGLIFYFIHYRAVTSFHIITMNPEARDQFFHTWEYPTLKIVAHVYGWFRVNTLEENQKLIKRIPYHLASIAWFSYLSIAAGIVFYLLMRKEKKKEKVTRE